MDTKQAKDEMAKGLRVYKAFEHFHDVLLKLEGLEQTVLETSKRVEELRASEEDLLKTKNDALAAVEAAKKEIADNAKEVITKAKSQAADIVATAEEKARILKYDAQKVFDEKSKNSAAIQNDIADFEKVLSDKKKEFADINAAVESHRAGLAKFLKG